MTRELLDHVLEVADLRNVEIQVMPTVQETHAGLDGPMRLLETLDNQRYAYCEGQESGQFIADPKVVGMLLEVALTPTTIHIRDSKTPQTPHVTLSPTTWTDFVTAVAPRARH